ncbi:MAG: YlxR family protein [Chloroflexi bacterium]|nr:YlxR family protein [Chloroflexota bacterium]
MKSSVRSQPQRTCVVCRQKKLKHELVRIVRSSGNIIELDLTGKKPGRGTYLCRTVFCFESGLISNKLEFIFKIQLSLENKQKLFNDMKSMLSKSDNFKGS